MDLNLLWFVLLGVLLTGYAILDGFDLGVGMLHPVAKTDKEKRIMMNSIGPLWDGNEVWLVTFGGALFAAFPEAYATIFSTFYNAFYLLLFALIFRAVSMEFRSKRPSRFWRGAWDKAFFVSSFTATLLFGVAVGNMMQGLPLVDRVAANIDTGNRIAERWISEGTFLELLNPYALLVGFLAVSLFVMHGSIYLYLKTEGDLQRRVHDWIWRTFGFFLIVYVLTTIFTLVRVPQAVYNFEHYPIAWVIVVLNVLAIANIPRAVYLGRPLYAFISSCCTIAALVFLLAIAVFPNLVVSTIDPAYSLDIYNGASSQKTLGIMAVIALIGMPIVLSYTAVIYWTFRGKVELGKFSY